MICSKHEKTIDLFRIGGALLVLQFIILLAGCASTNTRGVNVEPAQLEQIKIGQTTQAEVEALLGKPTYSKKSRGQTEMNYSYQQYEHRDTGGIVGGIPAAVLFSKSHFQGESATIIIGKDGKVADIKRMAGDFHSTGLLVKDDYPHPDFTKVDEIQPGVTTQEQAEALLGTPPFMSMSLEGNTREWKLWHYNIEPFECLAVYIGRDGIVDEVGKSFKGARWFPKRVNANKVAQIKERQSTREAAESVLGRPSSISRNVQGSFYTYYIQVGKTKEGVYIQYDNSGVITRLIRKPQPEYK